MYFPKLYYFNTYVKQFKSLLLFFFALLTINCIQKDSQQVLSTENSFVVAKDAVNLNTASVDELVKIPHIGTKTAEKIIEHREIFGGFRKPEHLLFIDRISDARFRQIRSFIKTE